MLLSAQMLQDVTDVNHFRAVNQVAATAGSTIDVYFRLVDRDADTNLNPPGRRYIPAVNCTLAVGIRSVYPNKQLLFPATNPFPQDTSIWYFRITPNDGKFAPAPGGGPIIDYSNLIPIGAPFNFNVSLSDFGMVGTFGLNMILTENPGWYGHATLLGVSPGGEITINGVVFTCVASGATGTQFDAGLTDALTAMNLSASINANSITAQVSALAADAMVQVTAVRASSLTWSGSASFTLTTPALSPDARVTNGWVPQALSIAPSNPTM